MEAVQLAVNVLALVAGAGVWKLYIDNLHAGITAKNAEISAVEKSRDHWKERFEALEQRSPEAMEKVLSDRIEMREKEIGRLTKDREVNEEAIDILRQERALLKRDLEQTKVFLRVLELEKEDVGDLDPSDNIEVVRLGEVGVDSGQLMITDPCYVDSEWTTEEYGQGRIYDDPDTGLSYEQGRGFRAHDDVIPSLGATVQELAVTGRLVERPKSPPYTYSYNGACQATSHYGYGELSYRLGHAGAGVAFNTYMGDGVYPVYGEMHDGRMVRVYVNVV